MGLFVLLGLKSIRPDMTIAELWNGRLKEALVWLKSQGDGIAAAQSPQGSVPLVGPLSRAPLGVFISPLPIFLYIWQTNEAINAKLAVPFGPSILHPMCK